MGGQTNGAYSAGNFVDTKLSLTSVGSSGIVQAVKVFSKSPQTGVYWVVLFNADPTGSTISNNAAGSIVDADLNKIIGVVACDEVFNLAAGSVHQAIGLGMPYRLVTGTTMWAAVITVAGITQTSTSDMILAVDILPD
jgi:hypothetical protein